MSAQTIERLKLVLDVLLKTSPDRFNIQTWLLRGDDAVDSDCGTVGCAIGLATLDPCVAATGLILDVDHYDFLGRAVHMPRYKNAIGFGAVAKWLDMHESQVLNIFHDRGYDYNPTYDAVVRRIEEAIKWLEGRIPSPPFELVDGYVLPYSTETAE